jgi:hypothetical protein
MCNGLWQIGKQRVGDKEMTKTQGASLFGWELQNMKALFRDNNGLHVFLQRGVGVVAFLLVATGSYLTVSEAWGKALGVGSILFDVLAILLTRHMVIEWRKPNRDIGKVAAIGFAALAVVLFVLMASMNAMSTGFQREAAARAAAQGRMDEANQRVEIYSRQESEAAKYSSVNVESAQAEIARLESEFWQRKNQSGLLYSEIAEPGTFAPKTAPDGKNKYKTAAAAVKAEWASVSSQIASLKDGIRGAQSYQSLKDARKSAEEERDSVGTGSGITQATPMVQWVSKGLGIDTLSATNTITTFMAVLMMFASVYGFSPIEYGEPSKKVAQEEEGSEEDEPKMVVRPKAFPPRHEQPHPQWDAGMGNTAMAFSGRPLINGLSGMGNGSQQSQYQRSNSFAPQRQPVPEVVAPVAAAKPELVKSPVQIAVKEDKPAVDTSMIPGMDEQGHGVDPEAATDFEKFRHLHVRKGLSASKALQALGKTGGGQTLQRWKAKVDAEIEQGLK